LICGKPDNRIAVQIKIDRTSKDVSFVITKLTDGDDAPGTTITGGAKCLVCKQITSTAETKRASLEGTLRERIMAVMVEGKAGKAYRSVEPSDLQAFENARTLLVKERIPGELMPDNPDLVSGRGWNFKTWGSLFNTRQLVALQTFIDCLQEARAKMATIYGNAPYVEALSIYLAIWIDRIAVFGTNMSRWRPAKQEIENPFDGQAIHMVTDYPEVNPLSNRSGSASTQLRYMLNVVEHEALPYEDDELEPRILLGSATGLAIEAAACDYLITDPPYDDAVAYGDLSDFFYVWLKRTVGDILPDAFATPLTPRLKKPRVCDIGTEGPRQKLAITTNEF
jgi:putative DNA methylase